MKLIILLLGLLTAVPGSSIQATDHNTLEKDKTYVTFDLRNKSMKSIPLLIPGVMNPNLSPMSRSGVSLEVGQKILFRYKGKKRVLLIVTEDLEGATIEVSKLLKERKWEVDGL